MTSRKGLRLWIFLATAIFVWALAPLRVHASSYVQHNLASDIPLLADYTDPNLVDPWGFALAPFWPCNHGSGTYNVQAVDGAPTATVTIVPTAPGKTGTGKCTGAARNNNAAAFRVDANTTGTWLLDTEDGLITIRSGAQNIIKVDNSGSGAVYKGLALSNNPDLIYAANFNSGKIDVYDGNWAAATLPGNFTDPQVPAGFAPFNIQLIAGNLYVTYAKQDANKVNDVGGPGNGYVAVFDLSGNLKAHLISGGQLNSPWGVAIAPSTFGDFKGALLVGNFRDGLINAFDATNGNFLGTISDPSGKPIVNVGLWALFFGTGGNGGDNTKLYFTAGISHGDGIQSHGLFGTISVAVNVTAAPSVPDNSVVNNASYTVGTTPLAPGSIAAIFGSNLTDGTSCVHAAGCDQTFDNNKRLRTFMAGTTVMINNSPVPIFYATPAQLGVQIPPETTGTSAQLQVITNGQASAFKTVPIGPFSPGIFSFTADGKGAGAITHNDNKGTPVDATNPATPGETIVIYGTGFGQVTPAVPIGAAPTGQSLTTTTPTVTIDGLPAAVVFSGRSPCCVGLDQLNVTVPAAVHVGTAVNVSISIGGQTTNTVTLQTKAAAGPAAPPPPPAPVPLSSLTVGSTSMQAGANYQGMVSLNAPAPSDASVALSSSNTAVISVPASVTIPAGSMSATFPITTSTSLSTATSVTITASEGGVIQTTTVTVMPPPPPPPPPNPYGY